MKEHQRQMVLLVFFMSMLVVVFLFMLAFSPGNLEIDTGERASSNQTQDIPEPVNKSLYGINTLLKDATSGTSLLFKSGKGS